MINTPLRWWASTATAPPPTGELLLGIYQIGHFLHFCTYFVHVHADPASAASATTRLVELISCLMKPSPLSHFWSVNQWSHGSPLQKESMRSSILSLYTLHSTLHIWLTCVHGSRCLPMGLSAHQSPQPYSRQTTQLCPGVVWLELPAPENHLFQISIQICFDTPVVRWRKDARSWASTVHLNLWATLDKLDLVLCGSRDMGCIVL